MNEIDLLEKFYPRSYRVTVGVSGTTYKLQPREPEASNLCVQCGLLPKLYVGEWYYGKLLKLDEIGDNLRFIPLGMVPYNVFSCSEKYNESLFELRHFYAVDINDLDTIEAILVGGGDKGNHVIKSSGMYAAISVARQAWPDWGDFVLFDSFFVDLD